MKAQSSHFHSISSGREECIGVFRVGRYRMTKELACYKDGDTWRTVRDNKKVEIKSQLLGYL